MIREFSSWQECYGFAAKQASTLVYHLDAGLMGVGQGQLYLYLDWTFHDGYLFDSSGKVNRYTDASDVQQGDRRKLKNGSFFD